MADGSADMLVVRTRDEWRQWLASNHESSGEIWLVYYKRHTGKESIAYDVSVEEALCFGWIDSIIRRLDDDRYLRKFTPRRSGSVWSEANKKRVERMIVAGRMTSAGQSLVDHAKASGEWDRRHTRPDVSLDTVPEELRVALADDARAARFFDTLRPTDRKQCILWIATAKKPDTRERRTRQAIERLRRGKRLGLK